MNENNGAVVLLAQLDPERVRRSVAHRAHHLGGLTRYTPSAHCKFDPDLNPLLDNTFTFAEVQGTR